MSSSTVSSSTSSSSIRTQNVLASPSSISSRWSGAPQQDAVEQGLQQRHASLFLRDGVRRVDYVLVTEPAVLRRHAQRANKRYAFERRLREAGLELEEEPSTTLQQTAGIACVKVHAPFRVLCEQAELHNMRMPIQEVDMDDHDDEGSCCSSARLLGGHTTDQPQYFMAPFSVARIRMFMMSSESSFFSSSQRSRLVYDMMKQTQFVPGHPAKVGVKRLIQQGVYKTVYPLHEGPLTDLPVDEPTERQLLHMTWSRFAHFYKRQPLDLIRKYYGEKVGMYFAWLGYYTTALWPAALLGLLCVLYGALTFDSDTVVRETCQSDDVLMCPLCAYNSTRCRFWPLSRICAGAKFTYVLDNTFTVVFAGLMSVWATVFMEGWQRRRYSLAWKWDLLNANVQAEESEVRPEFEHKLSRGKHVRKSKVTGVEEPFLPFAQRLWRYSLSVTAVFTFIALVLVFVFGVIVYTLVMKGVLAAHAAHSQPDQLQSQVLLLVPTASAALINLVCILVLNLVYNRVAYKLTQLEIPRTESEFDRSYTIKVFLFEFVNYYSALFYIAFFRGKVSPLPSRHNALRVGRWQLDTCPTAGCMYELVIHMFIIMVVKQAAQNALEFSMPFIYRMQPVFQRCCCRRRKNANNALLAELLNAVRRPRAELPQWEADYWLADFESNSNVDCLFDEYKEMVIQYGFVTLFVAAFPLAPLFALLNNIIEIRLDAFKFNVELRRPKPIRADDIGPWKTILEAIGRLAVLTNACVIAFTSNFVPKTLYWAVHGSHEGFVAWQLSVYDPADLDVAGLNSTRVPACWYADLRQAPCALLANSSQSHTGQCDPTHPPQYPLSLDWWHVLAARLAFVLVFEHCVFALKQFFSYVIPDMPTQVIMKMQREQHLVRQSHLLNDNRSTAETSTP